MQGAPEQAVAMCFSDGMSEHVERLRAQAARARLLLKATTDPMTVRQLTEYAEECERNADLIEARQTRLH
ncbi:MAG: hypothetical protein EON87_16745 [Brevundimonas sp.]|nr:MAG: hypothetical protein EON87_16745 [Brevundimonas sp.]